MPDQVDWRAIEREATPGRAVGRLLRDQREARGLDLSEVEKSLRIRRSQTVFALRSRTALSAMRCCLRTWVESG